MKTATELKQWIAEQGKSEPEYTPENTVFVDYYFDANGQTCIFCIHNNHVLSALYSDTALFRKQIIAFVEQTGAPYFQINETIPYLEKLYAALFYGLTDIESDVKYQPIAAEGKSKMSGELFSQLPLTLLEIKKMIINH